MGERGLKRSARQLFQTELRSLPMGERGLKRNPLFGMVFLNPVAPYGGAWIETKM